MTTRIASAAAQRLHIRTLTLVALACGALAAVSSYAVLVAVGASTAPPAAAKRASAHGLSPAALASISTALGADDAAYHFSAAAGGFHASNAAQHLSIGASASGVSIGERELQLALHLQGIGYGSSPQTLPALAPSSHANLLTYAHAGVSEWYANGPVGLEQGFTVTRAPKGNSAKPLTLAISLSGNAHAALGRGGQSVTFTAPAGGALAYRDLAVSDASGRALHGWLALEAGRLLLRVDARGARFPLRIDPTVEAAAFEEEPESKLTPKGDTEQRAGMSVALSADGTTALVGGPRGPGLGGAVWVFTRATATVGQPKPLSEPVYEQAAELTVPDQESASSSCNEHQGGTEVTGCSFGSTLALSANGETALVGAPHTNVVLDRPGPGGTTTETTIEHAGAAFVFTDSGKTWSQGVKLQSPQPAVGGYFGRSVALSENGETALIGAPGEDRGGGLAWVFTGAGAAWTQQGNPLIGEGEIETRFGRSVALSGNGEVAVIGAPNELERDGAAYVFEGSAAGDDAAAEGFHRRARLTGAGETASTRFGFSVAMSDEGNTLLVGAPQYEVKGNGENTGAVWSFARTGSEWSELGPKLTGPGEEGELFGYSVALSPSGATAIVGAPHALEGDGNAWLYERSPAGWGEATKQIPGLEGSGLEEGKPHFGASIASSATAEILLIGAPSNAGHQGAAWLVGRGPKIKEVEPSTGPPEGGTVVNIVGQHFTEATAVWFGDNKAESFEVDSEIVITAIAPPGVGTVPVTVGTPIALSEATDVPHEQFTYEHPVINSVTPSRGTTEGGTPVTIEGRNFGGVTTVLFGETEASEVNVESPTKITAVSPAASVGKVYVTVQAPSGESEANAGDRFVYVLPAQTTGKPEPKPGGNPNPPSGGQGSSGSSSPAGSPAIQVLAAGPAAGGACGASPISKKLQVIQRKVAVLKLLGSGAGGCRGYVKLRVKVKLGHGRFTLKTIGTAAFSVTTGRRVSVRVRLTRAGRKLLAAGHGRLNASVLIVKTFPSPTLARSASVRLAPQPAKRKPQR